jgi:hypothetical protein
MGTDLFSMKNLQKMAQLFENGIFDHNFFIKIHLK